jgi:hypothetical protein
LSLFSSCAFHQKYPAEWAALTSIEDNKCPDISGRYSIIGEGMAKSHQYESGEATWSAMPAEKTEGKIGTLYLYKVFPTKYRGWQKVFPMMYRDNSKDATYAQISQPDADTIKISYMKELGLITEETYSLAKKEYSCSANGIIFSFGKGGFTGGVAGGMAGPVPYGFGGRGWGKYYLAKSEDGYLIINEKGTVAAIFIWAPFWSSYENWYRFKPVSSP